MGSTRQAFSCAKCNSGIWHKSMAWANKPVYNWEYCKVFKKSTVLWQFSFKCCEWSLLGSVVSLVNLNFFTTPFLSISSAFLFSSLLYRAISSFLSQCLLLQFHKPSSELCSRCFPRKLWPMKVSHKISSKFHRLPLKSEKPSCYSTKWTLFTSAAGRAS